jgi:CHAT domain-containing protein
LKEIYELNLKGCELAILSACETNVGPEQRGEGIWSLSRGFLVAGSRRVVASEWLVNDEAAASLVSIFCHYLASAEKEGKKPDYAEALHKAKLWVRKNKDHPEWHSPYYWGTFVLIGPQ